MNIKRQDGYALIITLVALMILTMLGIALTFNSMTDARIANNYEAESLANMIAEAGLNRALLELRGNAFNTITVAGTTYTSVLVGANGRPDTTTQVTNFPFDARNPIPMNPADQSQVGSINPRLLDLTSTSQLIAATVSDDGVVSTIGRLGVPYYVDPGPDGIFGTSDDIAFFGNEQTPGPNAQLVGRYFVKVSNNAEDTVGGPFLDTDFVLIIRSMGIARSLPGETAISLTNIRNAITIVEARIRMDTTFQANSPFTVEGPNATDNGNRFFDGAAYRLNAGSFLGISVIDTSGNTDLTGGSMTALIRSAPFSYNTTGANPPAGVPSIANIVSFVQNGQTWSGTPNPDITSVLNANFVGNLIYNQVPIYADQVLNGDQGCNAFQGTVTNPKFIYVCGNLTCSPTSPINAAGLLVVTGNISINGNVNYNGEILNIGTGNVLLRGSPSVSGGIWTANLSCNLGGVCNMGSGLNCSFGTSSFSLRGNIGGTSFTDLMNMGLSLLPFNVKSWRVIHPEMEPN